VLVVDLDLWHDERPELGPLDRDVALVLLGLHDGRFAKAALRSGAAAYLLKDEAHSRLPAVLRELAAGLKR
jgi:DNA-binding NarL/FixJ family response regulator